jgi:HEAT repeat protein
MHIHHARGARAATVSFLLLGLALAPPVAAQDVRLLSTKVADILAQFPAGAPADRDKLADQVLSLGEPGIMAVVKQLVPSGTGNDTAPRLAVNAVAVFASKGPETKRAPAERALASAVGAATDVEVRTFLLSQLALVGRGTAVKAAAPLLADGRMVEPATQLMLTVRNWGAGAALLAGLDRAQGTGRITIVKGLGELSVAEANPRLLALADDSDPGMRRAALAALARIASPDSQAVLTAAARKAGYVYEPGNAVGALVEYAKRLNAKGSRSIAEKVCRDVMQETDTPERLATRTAALSVLADVLGVAILPDLLKAVDHSDRAYRNAALLRAERMGGAAVQQWIAKAQSVDAERRAEIITMLGRQGDIHAAPFVRASLNAPDPEVVLAAAVALGHMERAKAVPDLLALLKTTSPATSPGVAAVLGWTIDEKGLDPLAAMLDTLPPAGKAAALDVIGSKGGKRFASRVLPLTSDGNPEVRAAAFKALAGVVGPEHLPTLLQLLDGRSADGQATSPDDAAFVGEVQGAVAAAASQVTPEDARARPVLAAMKTASHPERFVDVLPQIGGKEALAALVDLFDGSNTESKGRAFRALVQWRGPEAADRLFGIYADSGLRDQAFGGFLRQISSSSLPDEQKVLQFRKALALNPPPRERRQLISALGRARTFQSFLVAASYLDDPDLKGDAAATVIRIALPTPGARDGLGGAIVRDALQKVLQVLEGPESEYDKENVRTYLRTLPQDEGFVPLFNGKDLTGWKGLVENPLARAKLSAQELAEKQLQADAKARTTWSVRAGTIVFNGKGDNLCTVKEYGDFEMLVDWRITRDGDSGIYLRGSPQVQIWDPARTDVGAEVGSGGLYNNQKNPSKPLVFADNPGRGVEHLPDPDGRGHGHRVPQRRQRGGPGDDGELLGSGAADLPTRRDRAAGARHRPGVSRHLRA